MNIEEMKKKMREFEEQKQNNFTKEIFEKIELWCEFANKKEYIATPEEKLYLSKILTILKDMNKWL